MLNKTISVSLITLLALAVPGEARALNAPVDRDKILDAEHGGDPFDAIEIDGHIDEMTIKVWEEDNGNPDGAHSGLDRGSLRRFRLKGHGVVTIKAIEILDRDELGSAFAMFSDPKNLNSLLDGLREEDYGGTVDSILHDDALDTALGTKFDSHSHSHFYDIKRKGGVAADIGRGLLISDGAAGAALQHLCDPDPGTSFLADTLPSLLLGFGVPNPVAATITQGLQELAQDWTYCTLVGPQIDAAILTDIHYARAVDAMRKGDQPLAMRHLGRALHLVQDLAAVPYHSTNLPGTADSNHRPYEFAVDRMLADATIVHAVTATPFYKSGVTSFYMSSVDQLGTGWLPSDYAKHGALASAAKVGILRPENGPPLTGAAFEDAAEETAEALIPLAEQLTAGLLKRFHDNWKYEDFAVTVLSIDSVKDRQNDADELSDADMFARVRTSTFNHAFGQFEEFARTFMYLQDAVSAHPNFPNAEHDDPDEHHAYSPTTWQVAKWHYRQDYEAGFQIEVFDDDGDWPANGERLDASPDPEKLNLWLKYDADGNVFDTNGTFFETGTPERTEFCLSGQDLALSARVCATLERIPSVGPSELDDPEWELPAVPDAYVCVPTDPTYRAAYLNILFGDGIDGLGLESGNDKVTGETAEDGKIWLWFQNHFIAVDCAEMSAAQLRWLRFYGGVGPVSPILAHTESLGELWSVNTDAFPYRWSPPIPEPNPELHPEFTAH